MPDATAEAPATAEARHTEEAPPGDASAEESADGDTCLGPHPPLAPSATDVMIARLRAKALMQSAASADPRSEPRAAAETSNPQGGASGTAAAADFLWLEGDKVPLAFAAGRPVSHFLYGHGFAVAVNPTASMPFLVCFHDGSSAEYAWACAACRMPACLQF